MHGYRDIAWVVGKVPDIFHCLQHRKIRVIKADQVVDLLQLRWLDWIAHRSRHLTILDIGRLFCLFWALTILFGWRVQGSVCILLIVTRIFSCCCWLSLIALIRFAWLYVVLMEAALLSNHVNLSLSDDLGLNLGAFLALACLSTFVHFGGDLPSYALHWQQVARLHLICPVWPTMNVPNNEDQGD